MVIIVTRLSLNSKHAEINEISLMFTKKSVEFIRCDNRVSRGSSRSNGSLDSILEKNMPRT